VILLLALPVGVVLGLLAGGRIGGLVTLRLRGETVLIASLVCQGLLPLLSAGGAERRLLFWAWGATFLIAVAVCLLNLRISGMGLVAVGLALNAAVILLNGGMPVLSAAVAQTGGGNLRIAAADFAHVAVSIATRARVLADVMPIPGPSGIRGVASAGDLFLGCGIAAAIASAMAEARSLSLVRLPPA
jgi:hypothetical protein